MDHRALLQGLRYVDSFFPSGGYAFSSGLESAVQGKAVQNAADLARYVQEYLLKGPGRCEAVAAARAHQAATSSRLPLAMEIDWELESLKLCRESRQASRQMGRQVVKAANEQEWSSQIMKDYAAAVMAGRTPGHCAVALGVTLAASGWDREGCVTAFLYQTAVGFVSAALKLLPIGQAEAQRLLAGWVPVIDEASRQAGEATFMQSWTPVHDIYAMRHSRLGMRLFRS